MGRLLESKPQPRLSPSPLKSKEERGRGLGHRLGSGEHMETLSSDSQVSLSVASGGGQVRHLAAASCTKVGSPGCKFSSLKLHVLP